MSATPALPRTQLTDALTDALPGVRVMGYARDVDRIPRDTVMVRLDDVTPAPPGKAYAYTLVVVGASTDDKGPGDDNLDALLERVLSALETHPSLDGVAWSKATRGTYLSTTHPAYEVATTTWHTTAPTLEGTP